MNEIWKDAWWTNGVYQVSNYGRVYNTVTKRFLKGSKNRYGYMNICLYYGGKKQQWTLHRLVVTVWQRPMVKGEDAHHKNHLKCCNCNFNLQIIKASEHSKMHNEGKILTQQHKRKLSAALKGIKHSQQWIRKSSEARKGMKYGPQSQQTKEKVKATKIKNGTWGKRHSQQERRKISERTKGRIPWNKGKKTSPEIIAKRVETRKRNINEK